MAASCGSGGGVSHCPGLAEEESASTPAHHQALSLFPAMCWMPIKSSSGPGNVALRMQSGHVDAEDGSAGVRAQSNHQNMVAKDVANTQRHIDDRVITAVRATEC